MLIIMVDVDGGDDDVLDGMVAMVMMFLMGW